jgi:hypothetical protein
MRRFLTTVATFLALATLTAVSEAQVGCPAEIGQAKELLSRKGGLRADQASQPDHGAVDFNANLIVFRNTPCGLHSGAPSRR